MKNPFPSALLVRDWLAAEPPLSTNLLQAAWSHLDLLFWRLRSAGLQPAGLESEAIPPRAAPSSSAVPSSWGHGPPLYRASAPRLRAKADLLLHRRHFAPQAQVLERGPARALLQPLSLQGSSPGLWVPSDAHTHPPGAPSAPCAPQAGASPPVLLNRLG